MFFFLFSLMGLLSFVLDLAKPLLYFNQSSSLVTKELNNKDDDSLVLFKRKLADGGGIWGRI